MNQIDKMLDDLKTNSHTNPKSIMQFMEGEYHCKLTCRQGNFFLQTFYSPDNGLHSEEQVTEDTARFSLAASDYHHNTRG